jgi:3-phosphoshikimate 1-carboxyvinyltransferase
MATRFYSCGPLRGGLRPPADKSISHRAALIGAMSEGQTEISGYLDSADTNSTLSAVRALGATVEGRGSNGVGPVTRVHGVGLRGARPARIDVGNAGTLLRILPGWLAGQPGGTWTLDGDDSIRRRPVDRIAVPLREMGARLSCREDRLPPLELSGGTLKGISYKLPIASAQVKSCLLFAALLAEGETWVREPSRSRDHTERMLAAAGADVRWLRGGISVRPTEHLEASELIVPADFSSAAFFIVAGLLVPGSEIELEGVGVNPTRTGLLGVLERMGARVEVEPVGEQGGEPVGTVRVRASALCGTEVGGAEVPLTIDELPLVALAACFAEGETTIRDAAELRRKESDRVATTCAALTALGARAEPREDGMLIKGSGGLRGGTISSHGDHRIAMLGAIAGLASREGVAVQGMEAAAVSYPGFEADLSSLLRRGG